MDSNPPLFTLEILEGPLAGKSLRKEGTSLRVGRTKASPLQIKEPSVSEKHAEIRFLDGHWQIKDLGSSNGTQLNGSEVTGELRTNLWLVNLLPLVFVVLLRN